LGIVEADFLFLYVGMGSITGFAQRFCSYSMLLRHPRTPANAAKTFAPLLQLGVYFKTQETIGDFKFQPPARTVVLIHRRKQTV
jgi:hypothetical protein